MDTTTIDSQILEYLPFLGVDEKQSLLGVIRSFINLRKEEHIEISSEILEYNRELDEALARVNAGQFVTQEEVERESAKW